MDERLIQARCIRYIAIYFDKYYIEPNNPDDENIDAFQYALEAYEALVESLNNRVDEKRFEYLTGLLTYEEFEKEFDADWIDTCADLFEKR